MSNSERLLEAVTWKIKQNATAIDCLQDFTGALLRVTLHRKTGKLKRCHLAPDSETEYEQAEKR